MKATRIRPLLGTIFSFNVAGLILSVVGLVVGAVACSKQALPVAADFQTMKTRNLTLEAEERATSASAQIQQMRQNRTAAAENLIQAAQYAREADLSARAVVNSKAFNLSSK